MSGSQQPADEWIIPDAAPQAPADEWIVPDAQPAPGAAPGLWDRFKLNFEDARRGTVLGAAKNLADKTTNPYLQAAIDAVTAQVEHPGVGSAYGLAERLFGAQETPEQRAARAAAGTADFNRQMEATPSFSDAPTLGEKIVQGGAALLGQVAGSMTSPENVVGGMAGGARAAGEGALSFLGRRFAQGAAVQAPAGAAGSAAVQGLDIAAGDRKDFSPAEVALAGAIGAGLGGTLNVAPELVGPWVARVREWRRARGATPAEEAAPIRPEEIVATWSSEDVRRLAEANGITDPGHPDIARLEERLGLRRAAEADPLVAAMQREDRVSPKKGQPPQTPAQNVAALRPGVEDQVAGEAASGLRFQEPGAAEAEIQRRLRSLVPGTDLPQPPPNVIALPGEGGRVPGQIIEPGAANSPRDVTVPRVGTGEPGVEAGAALRSGQGTALVPMQRPVTDPTPNPMTPGQVARAQAQAAATGQPNPNEVPRLTVRPTGEALTPDAVAAGRPAGLLAYDPEVGGSPMTPDQVVRARAQNAGGTLPDAARLSRVAQEVDADVAAGRVPRSQRDAELIARMGAQDIPEPARVPPEGAPRGPARPDTLDTYAGQNRTDIATREGSRPGRNGERPPEPPPPPPEPPPPGPRPPDAGPTPEPPPAPRAPEAGPGPTPEPRQFPAPEPRAPEPPPLPTPPDDARIAPWRDALGKAERRAGELQAEVDALNKGREARIKGLPEAEQGPASATHYKTPASLDRAIAAKEAQLNKLSGRATVLRRAIEDVSQGREPPARLEYQNAADNAPAIPGEPKPPKALVQRIRDLGGIRDDRGDFIKYQIPGLVQKDSRFTFESMADHLATEGYFPQLRGEMQDANGPRSINVKDLLLNAIEESQSGRPTYTVDGAAEYAAAVQARQVAIEQADAVARDLGLTRAEVAGLTRGQVADHLAERRSLDDLGAMVRALDDEVAAAHVAAEAEWRSPDGPFAGRDVPVDTERARSRPVTQEDIEHVPPPDSEGQGGRSQERSPGGPDSQQPGGQRGGEGGGPQAQGEGGGPAGGGAGEVPQAGGRAAERGGQQGTRSEGPATQTGQQPGELIQNDSPATQAQKAREARGGGRIRSEAKQKGVEDFELFDPEARKQGTLPEVTAKQVEANIKNKLYSGMAVFDPEAWKWLFGPVAKHVIRPFVEAWREFDIEAGKTAEAARALDARTPRAAPGKVGAAIEKAAPDASRWYRASGDAIRSVLYADGAAMRAMADKLPAGAKAAAHEFLDHWHANAGRAGTGKGATYDEGVGRRFTSAVNRLQAGLGDILKTPAQMDQVVKLVQNPGSIRPGTPLHDAAKALGAWLDEHHAYMRANGVDVGKVARGYFPRRLDIDAVWKDNAGFLRGAEKAYRAAGLSPADAKDAAARWLDNIRHNGADPTSPTGAHGVPGLSADHVSERVLPKIADEHLAAFLQRDPKQVLVSYAHAAARRAELARVLGPDNANWKKLAAGLKADGAEGALPKIEDFVRTQTGHVSGVAMNPRLQNALGWVRLWGTMGLLSKATITSLTEIFNAGARSGNVLDAWNMAKTMTAYHLGMARGERLRLLAEDVGTMTNHLAGGMAAARWTGGRPTTAAQTAVADRYFRAIGLEQWTHGMNVGATGVGDTFIRRMVNDLGDTGRHGRVASFSLAELGIPRDKHAAFAAWMKANAKDGMTVEALAKAPKEIAEQYRSALYRFTRQVSVQPGAVSRPRWANSPLGSLAFHLSAYAYAIHDAVLMRAKRVFENGDLTTGDKLLMAGKMLASLSLTIPAQMALGEARSAAFDSKRSRESYAANRVETAISRSGITGAIDPWLQVFAGVRYSKDLATSALGPTLGRIASGAQVVGERIQAEANPFGPPRHTTDSQARKLATTAYDMGLAPMVVKAAVSRLPLPIAAAVVQAMGASATREAFVSAVGAPPPRSNRHRR